MPRHLPAVLTVTRSAQRLRARLSSFSNEVRYLVRAALTSLRNARRIRKALLEEPVPMCTVPRRTVVHSGTSWVPMEIELYLAWLIARAGGQVTVLVDDGVLAHWDAAQFHSLRYYSPYKARKCIRYAHRVNRKLMEWAFRHPSLSVVSYSAFVSPSIADAESPPWHRSFAESSVKRFFQDGDPQGSPEKEAYLKMCLHNCRVSDAIGRFAVESIKAQLFITSHGIYSLWGPAYRVASDAGIPTAVWQTAGTMKGGIRIVNVHDGILVRSSAWQTFRRQAPFPQAVTDDGARFLDARINLTALDTSEYFAELKDGKGNPFQSEIPEGMFTFGLFPNVVWDGDIEERNIMFSNVVDWCVFTIRCFRDLPHHLIIRFHPSEVTRLKGSLSLESVVRSLLPDIDSYRNIHLIPACSPVNSYQLAKRHIDIGLIYDGHLCVELPHMGIPVIACTNGNFTDDSFVCKPSTKSEYEAWLAGPEVIIRRFAANQDEIQSTARAFAFWEFSDSTDVILPMVRPFPPRMDYDGLPTGSPISPDGNRILGRIAAIGQAQGALKGV